MLIIYLDYILVNLLFFFNKKRKKNKKKISLQTQKSQKRYKHPENYK
uniref:Uncharacterized protein n=1 Tax=Rhizophora mucronata TaxID=61149 RepID=A0A2P2KMF3_RHIMU